MSTIIPKITFAESTNTIFSRKRAIACPTLYSVFVNFVQNESKFIPIQVVTYIGSLQVEGPLSHSIACMGELVIKIKSIGWLKYVIYLVL